MAFTTPKKLSPRASRWLVRAAANPLVLSLITRELRRDLGVNALRALPQSFRSAVATTPAPVQGRRNHEGASEGLPALGPPRFGSSSTEIVNAYRSGLSPTVLVERFLWAIDELSKAGTAMNPMEFVDREQALEDAKRSADRYARGASLGPLDGVIVPVKEELDLKGHGGRLGLKLEARVDATDAAVVERLRGAGAIVIGTTMMTEFGMTPLGFSSARVLPRNVHDGGRSAGGSSTGSAVAVGLGLCPLAIGSDGGGSIRIPASWNGLFGIKPTFGRISRYGDGFAGTMSQLGPLAVSSVDLARVLECTAGADPRDELTRGNSGFDQGWLEGATRRGVKGLVVGVLVDEIDAAEPAVASACREAIRSLEADGAIIKPVELRLSRHIATIGFLTIGLECLAEMTTVRRDAFDEMGLPLQVLSRLLSGFAPDDYLDAQAFRATLRADLAATFRDVDALVCPTTQRGALKLSEDELRSGYIDVEGLNEASRFVYLANLCGLPAGTAPIGSDGDGMPVGLQVITDAWDEATNLQVLSQLERSGAARTREPQRSFDLLR